MTKFEKGLGIAMIVLFIILIASIYIVIKNFSIENVGANVRQIQQEFNKGYGNQEAKEPTQIKD